MLCQVGHTLHEQDLLLALSSAVRSEVCFTRHCHKHCPFALLIAAASLVLLLQDGLPANLLN